MDKQWYIKIGNEEVPVSEDVYRAFKRPLWAERKRQQVRAEHELSLNAFVDSGYDVPANEKLMDEIIEDKMLLEMLFSALNELTDDERALIEALYFDEKSEREIADSNDVTQQAISKRKNRILAKLRKMFD